MIDFRDSVVSAYKKSATSNYKQDD
jgi:hypothetical protein